MAVLFVIVSACATYPPPKIQNGCYYNYEYGFMLDLPAADWVPLEEPPPQLKVGTPRELRKNLMLALINKETDGIIVLLSDKTQLSPQEIVMHSDRLQAGLFVGLGKHPETKYARHCHDSSAYLQDWDICVEFEHEDAISKSEVNMFVRIFPVGNNVNMITIVFASNNITYDQNFPAFVEVVKSLRHGDEYTVSRSNRFIQHETGVVKDKKTGLEWFAGPDRNTTWYEAKAWVESLSVSGGGWRMPTSVELGTLFQRGVGTRNMTPFLKTSGWMVWCGDKDYFHNARGYNFGHNATFLGYQDISRSIRAFAVRSRK